jgi:transposase-like protein
MTVFDEAAVAVVVDGPARLSVDGPRAGRPVRRVFTAQYKRAVVAEYDAAPKGTKGAVLRREGLYDSHVLEWRAQVRAGTLGVMTRRGRPTVSADAARIAELEREVKRLQAQLADKDATIAKREAALDVLGKGVAFLEALSAKDAR